MKLRIGILGTRGIPNNYGGFEKVAEKLSAGLVAKGHAVFVYNTSNHPFQGKNWQGVNIIHCYDPSTWMGTAGQFIYDLNCIINARSQKFDILLVLGYTSSSVWGWLYPRNTKVVTNMDGLEWQRAKYAKPVQAFLRFAERLAIKYSDEHIADAIAIKEYLDNKYNINATYIAYGADMRDDIPESANQTNDQQQAAHFLLMARMEPENNIETVLDGFIKSNSQNKFKVVGNTSNKYGRYLKAKYKQQEKIEFLGPIFQKESINELTNQTVVYFHGHSVGGTNPSLLEAMASGVYIAAHDNIFNKSILEDRADYFSTPSEVQAIVDGAERRERRQWAIDQNRAAINNRFNWKCITNQYEQLFMSFFNK